MISFRLASVTRYSSKGDTNSNSKSTRSKAFSLSWTSHSSSQREKFKERVRTSMPCPGDHSIFARPARRSSGDKEILITSQPPQKKRPLDSFSTAYSFRASSVSQPAVYQRREVFAPFGVADILYQLNRILSDLCRHSHLFFSQVPSERLIY